MLSRTYKGVSCPAHVKERASTLLSYFRIFEQLLGTRELEEKSRYYAYPQSANYQKLADFSPVPFALVCVSYFT